MPSRVPRVLLADDQRDILEALQLLLKSEGFQVQSVTSPAAVLAAIAETDFDAALIDLNYARDTTSGQEGLDLLARMQSEDPMLPVIVLTAWASVDVAVEAMRRGARDFVQKPWDNARLLAIVRTQVELSRALRRGRQLEGAARLSFDGAPPLIARSPAMKPVIELIERTAPSDANVLITGENGTGKGLVAQAIHALSPRAARPMVTVNAGGVSETVFESELFGHVRGAFTDARADRVGRFELADGGTLFLDEIANVPPSQQAKLLRVHRRGRVRAARLVAHPPRRRAHSVGDERRHRHRSGGRAVPAGSAVPPQHDRNRAAAACAIGATTFRRSPRTFSSSTRGATART